MLVTTVAHPTTHLINPRDVVVAIVGGTMLTLALTRPRLRWLEQLTAKSRTQRLWAERALTVFSFVMGGYAWVSLFMVLHKQLGPEISAMLKGAAAFIVLYASLVHFEPFLGVLRSRGGTRATVIYICIATAAILLGGEIAILVLEPSPSFAKLEIALLIAALVFFSGLMYKWT